ncbi:MAG: glucosaminidase domain-containing protein [Roseiflexus sp.]|nr:glucosaminidase domain-containing protein [Roseiflexus sp.]MCS7289263.1 glucosaminidase domain-containing protein [Roseiflexus sp.]MDW8232464.1 glucosaminidase domain-containing protein [Roseiflexaceae bacterium]
MNNSETEKYAERRRDLRSTRQTDCRLPERPSKPVAQSYDPFDDPLIVVKKRRFNERRTHVQEHPRVTPQGLSRSIDGVSAHVRVRERLPAISSFAAPLAEEPLVPDTPFAIDDGGRDMFLTELVVASPVCSPALLRRSSWRQEFPWRLLAICIVSLVVLALVRLWDGAELRICAAPGCTARKQIIQAQMIAQSSSLPVPAGQHSVLGPPSLSAQQIDRILAEWRSPAAGTGATWVELGIRYGIDPAYALAFFIHESGAGTAPGWAGRKPDGSTTHNIGNIICAGYRTCYGRFRDYASWEEGIEDWYRLIAVEYVQWRGIHTVEEIVPIYAPAVENNVPLYIDTVNRLVAEWRALQARQ